MSKRDPKRQLPDWYLWTEVVRTVDPLHPKRAKPLLSMAGGPLPVPSSAPAKPRRIPHLPMPSYQSDGQPRHEPPGQVIEPRMRRRLGRGQIEIDGTIDLHGMRQAEAHAALACFIRARSARGDRTLLVITGKGLKKVDGDAATIVERGVLRSMLPIWLGEPNLAPLVAGWDVSAQGHGGEGAYYVRLR
ncbi:MAG: Smr/MutS family protein, partial [Devosia sp.]